HGERGDRGDDVARAVPTQIRCNHAPAGVAQMLDLWTPHRAIEGMAVYQEERARSRAGVVVRDPDLIEVDGRHGGKTSLNRQWLATAPQAALMGSDPLFPKQTGASGHCRMRPSFFHLGR